MQPFSYHIDLVLCVDVTEGMQPLVQFIQEKIPVFPTDLHTKMWTKDKTADQLRIRVVAFGDCQADTNPLNASPFYTVLPPHQTRELNSFVGDLRANGGGDEPESGLEALAVAMASDWVQEGDRQRHIIVMFTDASAHRLEDRVGNIPTPYAAQIPTSLDELTNIWEGGDQSRITTTLKRNSQRLMLFAPDTYPWPTIGDNWSQTLFLSSEAGEGLAEVEYDTILEVLANSV